MFAHYFSFALRHLYNGATEGALKEQRLARSHCLLGRLIYGDPFRAEHSVPPAVAPPPPPQLIAKATAKRCPGNYNNNSDFKLPHMVGTLCAHNRVLLLIACIKNKDVFSPIPIVAQESVIKVSVTVRTFTAGQFKVSNRKSGFKSSCSGNIYK